MAPTAGAAQAQPPTIDREDFERRRNEFVLSMAQLRHAADDATRTALAYFELMTGDSIMRVTGGSSNGVPPLVSGILNEYSRAHSLAPGARHTDEDDDGKKRRKRNVKPKDPNAPKKPATPFLLFCQTGRETVKGDLGPDASYQEVQDELKKRWNTEANKEEWSTLYQKRLAEWKTEKKEYDTQKEVGAVQAASTAATVAPMATVPVAIRGPASPVASRTSLGFTAVNSLAKPGSAPAAEAEEEEEEEEEEEDEEDEEDEDEETAASGRPEATEEASSQSESSLSEPPPKAKNSAKKNKNKATPIKPPAAVSSPIVAPKETPTTPAEQPKKKRGRPPKRPVEEPSNETIEVAQPAETPKRKRNKRRKSGVSAE